MEYFNNDLKEEFISSMMKGRKGSVPALRGLFSNSERMESELNKDLCQFDTEMVLRFFAEVAKNSKFKTLITFKSLITNYKDWVKDNKNIPIIEDFCTAEQIDDIAYGIDYVMFNYKDMDDITMDADLDGSSYNAVIFMRLLWELDGQESAEDICSLNINNLDHLNRKIKILNSKTGKYVTYRISSWLSNIIKDYAEMEYLTFNNKQGEYKIGTAESNNGYVFRFTKSKKTNPESEGKAITPEKMSNILHYYSTKKLGKIITKNDLLRSLALATMIYQTKTAQDMYNEKLYFSNMDAREYDRLLYKYGEEKYGDDFRRYINRMRLVTQGIAVY